MAPFSLDRILTWRKEDVGNKQLFQAKTLQISTLRIPQTFLDSKAYTTAFKPHVLEEVRSSLQSELELRRPGGTCYNVKITDFCPPKEPTSSAQRVLNILICDVFDNSTQKQTPLLPWDLVLLSERRIKSYDDLCSDRDLQYAFILITPPPKGPESDRDENGKRVPSSKRCANALIGPEDSVKAMWERLHNRIKDKKPESIWSIMPLINIATSRRVATALQGIDDAGSGSILDAVLDRSPSNNAQAPLCKDALAACFKAGLNRSQAEAVAKVSGSLAELTLKELARKELAAQEQVAWDQAAVAQAAIALLAPVGYCAMQADGGATLNPYQDSMYALEGDDLLQGSSSTSSSSTSSSINTDSDWFSCAPVTGFLSKKKTALSPNGSSAVSIAKQAPAVNSAAMGLKVPHRLLVPVRVPVRVSLALPLETSPVMVTAAAAFATRVCNSAIHMIQGPPGTGKTQTITQMCRLLAHPGNSTTILVCAPSNVAAGEIAQRVVKTLLQYVAPCKLWPLQQGELGLVGLLMPGGEVRGLQAAPDLSAQQAFPALPAVPPAPIALAATSAVGAAKAAVPATWAAITKPVSQTTVGAVGTSASFAAAAATAVAAKKFAATAAAAAAAGAVQAETASGGFLRSADVFLLGAEDRVDLTGPLAVIHVNVRVRLVLKALGPCWTGAAGNDTDCSWDLNVSQLMALLSSHSEAAALRCWSASEGVPGRGSFSVWLQGKLRKHYTELFAALTILGNHLPTVLMQPGWITAAECVLEILLAFISAVSDTDSKELDSEFSTSLPPDTSSPNSFAGWESDLSEDSDTTEQVCGAAGVSATAAVVRRRFYLRENLPPLSVGTLRDQLLSILPTTLHPGVPRPLSNEWKHVESWLMGGARVVLSTVSAAGSALMKPVPDIDVCIIDEAAQLVEAEVCIVLHQFPATKVLVLVGDHMQLPATVNSDSAKLNRYDRSLFQRRQELNAPIQLLNIQYRMTPEISIFPRREFYGVDKLLDGENVQALNYSSSVLPRGLNMPSMCFVNVNGKESSPPGSKSIENVEEAQVVARMVRFIIAKHQGAMRRRLHSGLKTWILSVGVMSMYAQQVLTIADLLSPEVGHRQRGHRHDRAVTGKDAYVEWEVRSVDGFQGRETDVIILSTVRCNGKGQLGHSKDDRRVNVALTRARHLLVVVGHADTLMSERQGGSKFGALIEHTILNNSYKQMKGALADIA